MTTELADGTRVAFYQNDWKSGRVLSSYHGLYGLMYRCRARGWADKYWTDVHPSNIRPLPEGSTRHTRVCFLCGAVDPPVKCTQHPLVGGKICCAEHEGCEATPES